MRRLLLLVALLLLSRAVSASYLGDVAAGSAVDFAFDTSDATSALTLGGTPSLKVYRANDTAEDTAGITLDVDFDGMTGLHHVRVDTSGGFYSTGSTYSIVIAQGTVGGVSVAGRVVGSFSIADRGSSITAADVWTYGSRTLTSYGTLVADIDTSLAGTEVTVSSPVTTGGDLELIPGDAYDVDHGRQLDVAISGAPSLAGATVKLVIDGSGLSITATSVANAGSATQTPRFELTAAQTAALTKIGLTAYRYQVQAMWAADTPAQPAVLARGSVSTIKRAAP